MCNCDQHGDIPCVVHPRCLCGCMAHAHDSDGICVAGSVSCPCIRYEPERNEFDCTACGACCRMQHSNEGYTPLNKSDIARLTPLGIIRKHPRFKLPVLRTKPYKDSVVCSALMGNVGKRVHCAIYKDRPSFCARFKPGSSECKEARERWVK